VVHATPLSAADIGCFRLSIKHVRLKPAPFIGHRAITGLPITDRVMRLRF